MSLKSFLKQNDENYKKILINTSKCMDDISFCFTGGIGCSLVLIGLSFFIPNFAIVFPIGIVSFLLSVFYYKFSKFYTNIKYITFVKKWHNIIKISNYTISTLTLLVSMVLFPLNAFALYTLIACINYFGFNILADKIKFDEKLIDIIEKNPDIKNKLDDIVKKQHQENTNPHKENNND